ncbi:MAG TPA: TylF/MycF/NovP-related O-methyltransferase [Solirubrobacteraceae bacterium]
MSLLDTSADPPHVAADRLLQIIEARFGDGLEEARAATATGPTADAEGLRSAYLTLLKLCLCDLAGTTTTSVARTIDGAVMSRELADGQLRFRAAGLDWPLHGLTMVGLARLDDLQACVESVIRDGIEGDLIEAGSWRGGASMLMRATLNSLGEGDRTLWVCDSFQGFPSTEATGQDGYDLDADLANCDFLAVPLEEVKANFARFGLTGNVNFVPGFFEDTLPQLPARRWAVARLDGDSYDATRLGLEVLYPNVAEGGYVVIDDYLPLEDCRRAVDDFRRERGITEPIEAIDWSGARWRKTSPPEPLPDTPEPTPEGLGVPRLTARSIPRPAARQRIPATEEMALRHELGELRAQLHAAQDEIEALRRHPLRGPRAWAAARLRRGGRA